MDVSICSTCRRPHPKRLSVTVIYEGRFGKEARFVCPKCADARKKKGEVI